MEDSLRRGFMAAFAVSGGVVFIAMHAHKRLLSDFINKMEFETKSSTGALKDVPKKVRFANVAAEEASMKKHSPRPAVAACRNNGETLEAMPQNWQVLYKGILQHRNTIRGG
ncbi:transmembrane protein [Perilla frutescens var. hirtella]|uniref:Transmembrane protein n=1 Tax=Perilla frutescens var. hirtella TaxID=608512 RepID=A0AAD4JAI0_PERFH|nr:transmembrane protein [Perilla frutescens var. hirtella]